MWDTATTHAAHKGNHGAGCNYPCSTAPRGSRVDLNPNAERQQQQRQQQQQQQQAAAAAAAATAAAAAAAAQAAASSSNSHQQNKQSTRTAAAAQPSNSSHSSSRGAGGRGRSGERRRPPGALTRARRAAGGGGSKGSADTKAVRGHGAHGHRATNGKPSCPAPLANRGRPSVSPWHRTSLHPPGTPPRGSCGHPGE